MATKRIYNVLVNRVQPSKLRFKHLEKRASLPNVVDLRSKLPPVYDQGQLGSCTANALGALFDFNDGINNTFTPSRLFIYYNERKLENSIPEDAGASLSDGIKTLKKYGVCSEENWPYVIEKFTVSPPTSCYKVAKKHKAIVVENIQQDINSMKTCLSSGFPFVVGFSVYESFESEEVAKTGIAPLPNLSTEKCLGGHAVLVVGYDDTKKVWIVRNSWGEGWGDKGYFTVPYEYFVSQDLASDLWNITQVTKTASLKEGFDSDEEVHNEDLQLQILLLRNQVEELKSLLTKQQL